jgi:saposin
VICQPFCSGSAPTQSFPDLSTLSYFKALTKPGSVESCVICKTVLGELQSLARDTKTQNTITAFLKLDVCAHTGSYNATCCSMIDRYAPSVFELIATFMDPNSRCAGFGFCPSQVLRVERPKEAESKKPASSGDVTIGPECVLCEFIMKELQSLLTDNATEAEIIAALDKVCSVMPASVKQPCLDFVNTYGPAIIALLQQELDPAQICTFLGMCTQSHNKLTPVAPAPVTKAADPEMCLLCETVVQYIEALLDQNATLTEIEAVVKKICNFLPDTMKTQCSDLIEEYGAQIVHFIASKYSPKEICTLLRLCTSVNAAESVRMVNLERPVSARRVGTSQCSYGPAYWCASQKNAEQCGAVDHCKRYVWKN